MYFGFAPATSSTPIAIVMITEAEPRSGWAMISSAGRADEDQPAEEARVADLVAALVGEVRARARATS